MSLLRILSGDDKLRLKFLISSSEHGSPRSEPAPMSPLQSSAQLFSGGNNMDAMSTISDATYPPHNYPPISPPTRAIPPGATYCFRSSPITYDLLRLSGRDRRPGTSPAPDTSDSDTPIGWLAMAVKSTGMMREMLPE